MGSVRLMADDSAVFREVTDRLAEMGINALMDTDSTGMDKLYVWKDGGYCVLYRREDTGKWEFLDQMGYTYSVPAIKKILELFVTSYYNIERVSESAETYTRLGTFLNSLSDK